MKRRTMAQVIGVGSGRISDRLKRLQTVPPGSALRLQGRDFLLPDLLALGVVGKLGGLCCGLLLMARDCSR